MPHDKKALPYLVLGSGDLPKPKRTLWHNIFIFIRPKILYPAYFFCPTLKKAEEAAERMKGFNDTVLICKITKVVK